MFFGIILGCAITLGGIYLADSMSTDPKSRPIVNWDVVTKNIDGIVDYARDSWKKIAG
jgi:hypothetical protein